MRAKDLVGQVFGRLTVVERGRQDGYKVYWICRCECGGTTEVVGSSLKLGKSKSCGCLRRETTAANRTKHGGRGTPEYTVWSGVKARCYNPKGDQYEDYGGRGIVVCAGWRDDFAAFRRDMGERPSPEHEIDRRNNDANYSCGHCEECRENGWDANCHWATQLQNVNNKRSNVRVTAFGETKTVSEWSRDPRCAVTEWALWFRITNSGWEPERAITEPSKKIATPRGSVEAFGESKTIAEWTRDQRCVVDYHTLKSRLLRGTMTAEEAITAHAP